MSEDRDPVLELSLNAPRDKVWRCRTEPNLMKQWFAPAPWTTPHVGIDLHPGGNCLIVMRSPAGREVPSPGACLEAGPGRTRHVASVRHRSVADREAHERMGFHDGWTICARQREALAGKLQIHTNASTPRSNT